MIRVQRLQEVLYTCKKLIVSIINEENYDNFISRVIDEYNNLFQDEDKEILSQQHLPFTLSTVALYKVLITDYKLTTNEAIELIYTMTYRTTEEIFDDMSFVQLAYYVMCNKAFLKKLILRSLTEFHASDLDDSLEEYELDDILDMDLVDTNVKDYFNKKNVPELIELLDRVDFIIEEFVEIHFTKKQRDFTLEDLL